MRRAVFGLVALVLLTGCSSLPESGPVTPGSADGTPAANRGVYFDPPPPRPGDEPEQIVQNFLVAMTASPLQTTVAREYLTAEAGESWNPAETLVYSGVTAETSVDSVEIDLHGAHRIDARGTWRGPLTAPEARLTIPVEQEDGEWRIAQAPNALIVPDYQFAQAFRAAQVPWFDPSGAIIVPEPVFVGTGDSLATAMVRSLLKGPAEGLESVVRTYVPEGLTATSVPVDAEGEADVRLSGTMPRMEADALDRLVAQFAWTLRQVPGITRFTVTVDDLPLTLPGGVTQFPVQQGSEYDPVGLVAGADLFALAKGGGLLMGAGNGFARTSGAADELAPGWRSLAVEPSGARAAGVTADGRGVQVASVLQNEGVETLATQATDLAEPAWDALGNLWLIDRTSAGALVMLAGGDAPRRYRSRGLSGEQVRTFLVSRDGSRLVAVVAGSGSDHLVTTRVRRDDRGRVTGLTPAQRVAMPQTGPVRIRDLAWRTPTRVAILFGSSREVSQVLTVSLDGSPNTPQTSVTTLRGDQRWLVGSPETTLPVYAVSREDAISLDDSDRGLRLGDAKPSTVTYGG